VRGAATPHVWFWDGVEHVDPAKEASAQATRLANHTTTLAHEFARQGRDWEDELRQRAKELALMRELGLPVTTKTGGSSDTAVEPDPEDTNPDTDETVTDEATKEAA
jgi:capsid protein